MQAARLHCAPNREKRTKTPTVKPTYLLLFEVLLDDRQIGSVGHRGTRRSLVRVTRGKVGAAREWQRHLLLTVQGLASNGILWSEWESQVTFE